MTYKKNFVAAVKVNGKVLRESNDRVELPFGSEYSILLKNLDSVRMQARITIDGVDAVDWVVINPNSSVEIERFLKIAGSLDKGNRFKFIERTARIEEHRGIQVEDGLVRIEFKREKVYEAPKVVEHHTYHHDHPYYCYPWYPVYPYSKFPVTHTLGGFSYSGVSGKLGSLTRSESGSLQGAQNVQAMNMNCSIQEQSNDAGITVQGSLSNQKFHTVSDFETESAEVLVLHLIGKTLDKVVTVAKTVSRKVECDTCGKKNKSSAKFCAECGTSLEKV